MWYSIYGGRSQRISQYIGRFAGPPLGTSTGKGGQGCRSLEDLFSNDKDLFRLIGLLTNADRKVLNSAYVNRKKLKKGGMQDILLNLVKEMWVAGLVFEKWDDGQHGRNSTHIWTRMNRVIKIIAEDKQMELLSYS